MLLYHVLSGSNAREIQMSMNEGVKLLCKNTKGEGLVFTEVEKPGLRRS